MVLVVERATRRWGDCCRMRASALTLSAGVTVAALGLITGCGSGSGSSAPPPPPPAPAVTKVTLVLSSTANDQLTQFDVSFQSISLTSASGKTVTLLSQARQSEFIHLNGTLQPLLTATIPQDTYTAATVSVGNAGFTCVTLQSGGGMLIDSPADGQTPSTDVTVTLPAPIQVTGAAMGLTLDLLVSRSSSYSGCGAPPNSYGFTPAFSLTSFANPSQPATSENGGVLSLDGQVTALDSDAGGFQITLPDSTSVHVTIDSATVWQGVAAFTALQQGTFVDLDGAIQSDGSIAATRVAVEDPSAVDVQRGPLLFVSNAEPLLTLYCLQQQGKDVRLPVGAFKFSGATFRISGQLSNLQALPFTPSFTAQNMVAGQTVYLSSPAYLVTGYNANASTVTLVPQTVDGTVFGVAPSGDFTVYSVSLASYDLFPQLGAQDGQTTLLSNPSVIEVYADSTTAMLTSSAPALGDTLRFYGLVFNDHGTLRMDSAQISAGVTAQ